MSRPHCRACRKVRTPEWRHYVALCKRARRQERKIEGLNNRKNNAINLAVSAAMNDRGLSNRERRELRSKVLHLGYYAALEESRLETTLEHLLWVRNIVERQDAAREAEIAEADSPVVGIPW